MSSSIDRELDRCRQSAEEDYAPANAINLPLNTIAAEIRDASSDSSDKENADIAAYGETVRHIVKNLFDTV